MITTIVIFAWSPWFTKKDIENIVFYRFEEKWYGVMDDRGFNCEGCGITNSYKIPFGYFVNIEYGCGMGMLPVSYNNEKEKEKIFVSFLGTIHYSKNSALAEW